MVLYLVFGGIVFKKNFFGFGAITGLLISLISIPSIIKQKTEELAKETISAHVLLFGVIGTLFGVFGVAVWIIKMIFLS